MTIHKSKGLEFPVCILAGASHQYNKDDLKKRVQLNSRYGIGLKVYNADTMSRYDSIQYSVLRQINEKELMSENLRVLYVALTRAKEQFVTFYTSKKIEKAVTANAKKIIDGRVSPVSVQKTNSDGDLIVTAALLHKDGGVLRDMCHSDIKFDALSDFDMSINVVLGETEQKTVDEVQTVNAELDPELLKKIKDRLSFRYDRLSLANYPSKMTASSLDDSHRNYEYLTSSKPAFLTEGNMTYAEKGTAMHTFMQYCDYDNARDDLETEIARLISCSYLTAEQAKVLDRGKLTTFFTSDFAKRIFGGAQGYFDVTPDLTIFGKVVAGGYPGAGGVGGKKEYAGLMAAGVASGKHRAYVGGTLAAAPISALAGYTCIKEIERTNACEIAGKAGDKLTDGIKSLIQQYRLPFVAYNQGSICHLECTGAMSFDFSSFNILKSAVGLLRNKEMMYERKDSMERMGAAYMANGLVTLAGSRLYTSMATTDEVIDDALNRFEEVFKHVVPTNKGLL